MQVLNRIGGDVLAGGPGQSIVLLCNGDDVFVREERKGRVIEHVDGIIARCQERTFGQVGQAAVVRRSQSGRACGDQVAVDEAKQVKMQPISICQGVRRQRDG